jgi:hypothetical protein
MGSDATLGLPCVLDQVQLNDGPISAPVEMDGIGRNLEFQTFNDDRHQLIWTLAWALPMDRMGEYCRWTGRPILKSDSTNMNMGAIDSGASINQINSKVTI